MMPEDGKSLNELERATSVAPDSLLFGSNIDETAESGFSSRAVPVELLAEEMLKNMQFADLETDSKTIIEAINNAAESGGGGTADNVPRYTDGSAGSIDFDSITLRKNATYEDLETEDKTIIGAINEVNSTKPSGVIYSTDEVEIGTWIDGSKIYRKVIVYSGNVSTSPLELDCAALNIKDIISRQITVKKSDGSTYFVPYVHTSNVNYGIGSYYSGSRKVFNLNGNILGQIQVIAILEYTKN